VRMLGAHNDITVLKAAEEQAAEEASVYKTFHENQSAYLTPIRKTVMHSK